MSAVTPFTLPRRRGAERGRIGRRAALALVALLVAGLAGAGILIANTIRQREQSRVDARLAIALQAAEGELRQVAEEAQQSATALATNKAVVQALARHDGPALARLTAPVTGAVAIPAGTPPPQHRGALERSVRVLSGGRLVGEIRVTVPVDGALLSRLRSVAPLASGEGLLFVRDGRVVGAPKLAGTPLPAGARSARLAGASYRVDQARAVGGAGGVSLAALAPAAEVERPVARAERLLAGCLGVTFVALLLLARILARPLLEPLSALERGSVTDELTGLPNRRGFADAAAAELRRARRALRPLVVAMVDVDDFKQVNDTFGHAAGDQVLRRVADVLRVALREIDLPARHGGEEFAVLFPETDVQGGLEAAERFRAALAELELGDGRTLPRRVTASVGVAAGDADVDELLAAADRALYRAKADGKNRVRLES